MARKATYYEQVFNHPPKLFVVTNDKEKECVSGNYYRQWDVDNNRFYYVKSDLNEVEEYYLFRMEDEMWTISKKYNSIYYSVYYPHETKNILACSSQWRKSKHEFITLNISENKTLVNKNVTNTISTQTDLIQHNTKRKRKKTKEKFKDCVYKKPSDRPICSICFEEVGVLENICKLPCKHAFHSECILPWLLEKKNCPNCRKEY